MVRVLFFCLIAVWMLAPPALAEITGTATVIDGNTLEIAGQRIRLHGIDAPESGQNCLVGLEVWLCGEAAAHALENFIGASPVTCQEHGVDRSGRTIAACTVRGVGILKPGWFSTAGRWPTANTPSIT